MAYQHKQDEITALERLHGQTLREARLAGHYGNWAYSGRLYREARRIADRLQLMLTPA